MTSDNQRPGGRACVSDLHVRVGDVPGWLAQGRAGARIVVDHLTLTCADTQARPACAAERASRDIRWVAT